MKTLLAALLLGSVCTACGDDRGAPSDPFGRPGMPSGFPTDATSVENMMKGSGTIELTDDMMQGYVEVLKQLREVKTPTAAMLARYKLDLVKWGQLSMLVATTMARTTISNERPRMEKDLADAQDRLAAAGTDEEREMIKLQIQGLEAQLESVQEFGQANDIDRKNLEVINRWKDRIEAAND